MRGRAERFAAVPGSYSILAIGDSGPSVRVVRYRDASVWRPLR